MSSNKQQQTMKLLGDNNIDNDNDSNSSYSRFSAVDEDDDNNNSRDNNAVVNNEHHLTSSKKKPCTNNDMNDDNVMCDNATSNDSIDIEDHSMAPAKKKATKKHSRHNNQHDVDDYDVEDNAMGSPKKKKAKVIHPPLELNVDDNTTNKQKRTNWKQGEHLEVLQNAYAIWTGMDLANRPSIKAFTDEKNPKSVFI